MTRTQFTVQMIVAYSRLFPDMPTEELMRRAAIALDGFLKSESIGYGHPGYDWDENAAAEIAESYERS